MMALTQENVHYTLNSGPDEQVEQGSCADPGIFVRRGGGGGGGRGPTSRKQSGQRFVLVIKLFYCLQSGSNGFITEGRRGSNFFQGVGCLKKPITCDFPEGGGVRTPSPPMDPHVGSPDATTCLRNQNLNKTEKYHPTTTKRKKDISCWSR